MVVQPNIIEIRRTDSSTFVGGLLLICLGILLVLFCQKARSFISGSEKMKTAASALVWTLALLGGFSLICRGFSSLIRTSGTTFYCERRELASWSRRLFLNRKYKRYSFDEF